MPVSIDRQIESIQKRIKSDQKKLKELRKKKKEMILRATAAANKKEISELIRQGKSTQEILSFYK